MTIFPFVIISQLFPLRHILSKWGCVSYLRHILGGMNNWTILCNNNNNNNNKTPHVPATLSQAYAQCLWLTFCNSMEILNKVIKTGSVLTTVVHITTISCNGKLYYIHSNFTPEHSYCCTKNSWKKGVKGHICYPLC